MGHVEKLNLRFLRNKKETFLLSVTYLILRFNKQNWNKPYHWKSHQVWGFFTFFGDLAYCQPSRPSVATSWPHLAIIKCEFKVRYPIWRITRLVLRSMSSVFSVNLHCAYFMRLDKRHKKETVMSVFCLLWLYAHIILFNF